VIIGNITAPVITMDEGVRFDGEMRMNNALEEAVRATTQRAPAVSEMVEEPEYIEDPVVEDTYEVMDSEDDRPDAMAVPDPSDLLNPTN